MSGTAGVGNTFQNAVTATGLQLDQNYSTIVAYLNDPTNRNNYAADGVATNTVVLTFAPAVVGGYSAGLEITWKWGLTNTGGVVVNANGLGNASLVNPDGSALWAGQGVAGSIGKAVHDGTRFIYISSATFGDYRSSQSYTTSTVYVKPAGLKRVRVTVVGGGGGGGGVTAIANAAAGGGGGGGASIKTIAAATLGATETVTIGSAGSAGDTSGTNGGTGGTSSFGAHCSATGGIGGSGNFSNNTSAAGNVGGDGSGGTINMRGGSGGSGNHTIAHGGDGGTSILGGGGRKGYSNTGEAPGGGYGGGGGGAGTGGIAFAGGAGFAGIVIVEEFF